MTAFPYTATPDVGSRGIDGSVASPVQSSAIAPLGANRAEE